MDLLRNAAQQVSGKLDGLIRTAREHVYKARDVEATAQKYLLTLERELQDTIREIECSIGLARGTLSQKREERMALEETERETASLLVQLNAIACKTVNDNESVLRSFSEVVEQRQALRVPVLLIMS